MRFENSISFADAVRILVEIERLADKVSPIDRQLVRDCKQAIINIMKGE